MKFPLAVALALALGFCLPGCEKPDPSPKPPTQAKASPTPKDELDAGTNRLKKKAVGAIIAVENFFGRENPKQHEKLVRDKAKWREKLRQDQKELQPQIDRLKEQIGKLDTDKTRAELRTELAKLEDQSKNANKKIVELEAAGQDAWKSFKAQLKAEEARNATPSPTP